MYQKYERNIALDLIFTVVSFGLWNLIVQYAQMKTINELLKEKRFGLIKLSLLSIITFGLYFIYFEYLKTKALYECIRKTHSKDLELLQSTEDEWLSVIMSFIGLHWVWDAIYQSKVNHFVRKLDQKGYESLGLKS